MRVRSVMGVWMKCLQMFTIAYLLSGCTAVPVGNKGIEAGDVGFQPQVHDIANARDLVLNSAGSVGLTIVSCLLIVCLTILTIKVCRYATGIIRWYSVN